MNTALRLVHGTIEGPVKNDYINRAISAVPKTDVLFSDFITQMVNRKAKRMSDSYAKNYRLLLKYINDFSDKREAIIYTNSVNEYFLDDFIEYLEGMDLKQSYIKSMVGLAKSMVATAARHGYAIDCTYDDVEVDYEPSFSVYLTMNEITRIYYFLGLTRKQEAIRDLFVVGCLTALRYSDYSTLTKDNFTKDFIIKKTKKTGIKVTIPLHDYVREIYTKYDGEISKGLSIQHFNRYIKMICREVGINDAITYTYTKGGKTITVTKEKWELISSHTARRSAATNMYVTGRMKTYEIMNLTGHTTEKCFFRYIKLNTEDKARQIAGDSFFRK